jgi:hypothetical protein
MKLETNNTEPGLLTNPDWREGQPGTFAVIIGASWYPNLLGGSTPASETYGLGQLAVSALTAYEWFRWLTSAYVFADAPLAKCWMLLSPTAAERAFEPELAGYPAQPTFEYCRKALRSWSRTMKGLSPEAARKSRALFFFSGHGIEIYQDKQILLPCDYLCDPGDAWNDAISTENVKRAMASLLVPYQFYFLDACRNGAAELRRNIVKGSEILTEMQSDTVNPDLVAPLLYATASGQQAFQQPDPGKGLSLFGTALLDGLSGRPDIALVRQDPDYAVNLYALQAYVKKRVRELLAQTGENVRQPVQMSGVVDDATVTFLKAYTVRSARIGTTGSFGREVAGGNGETGVAQESLMQTLLPVSFRPSAGQNAAYQAGDIGTTHDIFAAEGATELWQVRNVRVFAIGAGVWLPPGPFNIRALERTEDTSSYRLDLEFTVSDQVGYWLELTNPSGKTWGCVLPTSPQAAAVHYRLDFDVAFDSGSGREITRLEAGLATSNTGYLGDAARLWQKYQNADLGEAIRVFEQDATDLREIVRNKLDDPLAALVAAIVLLRAKRSDLLNEWLLNLATWFPYLPDGSVLWAEHLVRQSNPGDDARHAAAASLVSIVSRPLPFTSEGFSYAARLARNFASVKFDLSDPNAPSIERLRSHLDDAVPYLRPGGLFATYAEVQPNAGPAIAGLIPH